MTRRYLLDAELELEVDDEGVQRVTIRPTDPAYARELETGDMITFSAADYRLLDSSAWPALAVELPATIVWEG